jgi:hypothetical protein
MSDLWKQGGATPAVLTQEVMVNSEVCALLTNEVISGVITG